MRRLLDGSRRALPLFWTDSCFDLGGDEAHGRTPFDLSFDKMVAVGKVDFIGSEALEKVAINPPRRFKTLRLDGEELPEYGPR